MTSPREGSQVAYVGFGVGGLVIGDLGKVLAGAGSGSHVVWATGAAVGQIVLIPNEDLVVSRTAVITDDSLDCGPLVAIAVRDVYDGYGEVGLINALNDAGHLAGFTEIAEEALEWVVGKIGNDPSVLEALSHLDVDEARDVLGCMATTLLRDSFSEG